ncbi:MAG: hypothetical protein ABI912_00725 [Actinomycetota bacterium]
MTVTDARRVADAVLYEGYLLYPYRASSSKNQVRWQFGVLGPLGAAAAGVGEEPDLQAEIPLEPHGSPIVQAQLRFLHVQHRAVQRFDGTTYTPVEELRVGGATWIPWHEAVAEEFDLPPMSLADLTQGQRVVVAVEGGTDVEPLYEADGNIVGRLVRTRWPLRAEITMSARSVTESMVPIVRVQVRNTEHWQGVAGAGNRMHARDVAARTSFVSTHLLLSAREAAFISPADPGPEAVDAAAACDNRRCWPVLLGDPLARDLVLISPIILDDFPAVSKESPADLFDLTEIDEILTLRVLTMTDEEKAAARGTDPRAAEIVDRIDAMPAEELGRLHGGRRDVPDMNEVPTFAERQPDDSTPWWDPGVDAAVAPDRDAVRIGTALVRKGSRVVLRPSRRADAQDLFLAGQVAVVAGVYFDVDGQTHVAVVLEDDPAADLHQWFGRFWYFGPEEIEPLTSPQVPDVTR